METEFDRWMDTASPPFKSYYVVWKLCMISYPYPIFWRFKSYYVVWKPYSAAADSITLLAFKSYYVVWKPYDFFESICSFYTV